MKKIKTIKKEKKIKGRKFGDRYGWLFSSPGIFFNFIFGWYPLILGFLVAFQTFHLIKPPYFSGLNNFRNVFADPLTFIVFRNTFYYTALSLALTFLVPILVSILLMEMKKSTIRIMMILWFIPIAGMASLIIWKWFYNADYGLFNGILISLGLPTLRWLGDKRIAMLCLVLPGLIMYGPGLIYIASLQSIPDEFYEAAELEGCTFWQKIWHITLPRLRPLISMMLILAVIGNMQVFMQPFVMTGGGPGNATRSVVMFYYSLAFEHMRLGKGQAVALVLFIILAVLIYLQRRYFKENPDI